MKRRLKTALDGIHQARAALWSCIQTQYKVGDSIRWLHCGKEQFGRVETHGWYDRLKVHNTHTGRNVWIYAYQVTS